MSYTVQSEYILSTMATRPSKRQKIALERNPFIDIEAAVEYDEPEDEGDSEEQTISSIDDFVLRQADDVDDDIDIGLHAQVNAVLRAAEVVDQEQGEQEDQDDTEDEADKLEQHDAYDDPVLLSANDGLWEIPCIIGREFEALRKLQDNEPEDNPVVKSATFRQDHPGRIYIELRSDRAYSSQQEQARKVAAQISLDMLKPTAAIRFIPCINAVEILCADGQVWQAGMWARIREPKLYQGDIGFIFSRFNKTKQEHSTWIAVVPRIDIHGTSKSESRRPTAQTLDLKNIKSYLNIEVDYGQDFFFRNQTFNYSGYLLFRMEDVDLYPPNPAPPVPLLEEFDLFLRLPVLSKNKWAEHRLRIAQQRTAAHDRVKILDSGNYRGSIGLVLGVCDDAVEVYLPVQEQMVVVGITNIQAELQYGDYIRVLHGEHQGKEGYITKVEGEWVDVSNPKELYEVGDEIRSRAGPHLAEVGIVGAIHDGWLVVSTDLNADPLIGVAQKAQIDPYIQYCGRHAIVISGTYKGYRGLVKTTHPDGRMGLQLDTRINQLTHFMFDEIRVQDEKLALALPPPIPLFSPEPSSVIPEKRPISILFPDVERATDNTPTWRPRYKVHPSTTTLPEDALSPYLSHPSIDFPVPSWLLTGDFVPHRIRLIEITGSGPPVEYFTPAEDASKVIVRDKNTVRTIPVEDLRHIAPEKNFDLVVPITGDYRAQMMKVKDFGQEELPMSSGIEEILPPPWWQPSQAYKCYPDLEERNTVSYPGQPPHPSILRKPRRKGPFFPMSRGNISGITADRIRTHFGAGTQHSSR
ncbi:hypothetical protein D9619_000044 [Psilocybe cf. subviscida]|uniref:KOW domain-containing protein n=1 Tax=Psilocybe cf. subviscida TaxID=2480587 RepID=A0A8H5BGF0_9AGAR|nr:hypothetical protein D9619_000044 [Psilocybe cf. subviscida]